MASAKPARSKLWAPAAAIAIVAALLQADTATAVEDVTIEVVSNRADLVSGGDALVEISTGGAGAPTVEVDGRDVSDGFVQTGSTYLGRIEGLALGDNVVTATAGGAGATLTIKNHPIEGPVFSGPHISPWICTTAAQGLGAPDAKCNAPTRVDYFYQAEGTTSFAAYDVNNPPSDARMVTTDEGKTVPYIIRQETGTQNRGIYRIAVLHDPTQPIEPWSPPEAWNHKLFYPFGASCGTVYSQASAQNVQNNNALSRGFMVATSSLNVLGNNCNTVLSAETMMMLKEHIVDRYGTIRYTFGSGGSGGSIGQNMVANSYPGLLQGITETLNYPDTVTTGMEVFDCHLLFQYWTRNPHMLTPTQLTHVSGHGTSPATCAGWEAFFSAVENPRDGCGVPAEEHYHPENNPSGCRGRYEDFERNVWGPRPQEVWTAPEQAIGQGFAKALYDNVGVQFGLQALKQGLITTEQFVDLNEKIGGYDVDFNLTSERAEQDEGASGIAYRAGRINDAAQLDKVAIIDSRATGNIDPLTIHTMHHTFAHKDRIAKAHGTSANHVSWRGGEPSQGAFSTMDEWLSAVEADTSDAALAEKIIANKPSQARDECFFAGQSSTDKATCDTVWPYHGAPRIVAGMATTHDTLKCQTKPLNRTDPDFGLVPFTDLQWERLVTVFGGTGVCDWSKPSVDFQESVPWQTYAGGPGGVALGSPPVSQPL
jgi:hypothetical protein